MLYIYTYLNVLINGLKEEKGQGMAEYGLVLVLVALAAIAGFTLLGGNIDSLMTTISGDLVPTP